MRSKEQLPNTRALRASASGFLPPQKFIQLKATRIHPPRVPLLAIYWKKIRQIRDRKSIFELQRESSARSPPITRVNIKQVLESNPGFVHV